MNQSMYSTRLVQLASSMLIITSFFFVFVQLTFALTILIISWGPETVHSDAELGARTKQAKKTMHH